MTSSPLVSIIVPSFNQGRFLRQTLDSILGQSHRPLEILVMDGGSTDDTLKILRSLEHIPELHWESEPDNGPADAVNKGLRKARGSIAAIQSTDDFYLAGAIERAVSYLVSHPECGLVYGDVRGVDENGEVFFESRWPGFTLERYLTHATGLSQSGAFFRTDLARDLGGWNSAFYTCDTDLWIRMAFRADVHNLQIPQSCRRMHADQRDTNTRAIWDSYGRMIRASPDIRSAPRQIRTAAWSGRYLLIRQHNPWGHAVARVWFIGLALVIRPSLAWRVVPSLRRLRKRLRRGRRESQARA